MCCEGFGGFFWVVWFCFFFLFLKINQWSTSFKAKGLKRLTQLGSLYFSRIIFSVNIIENQTITVLFPVQVREETSDYFA